MGMGGTDPSFPSGQDLKDTLAVDVGETTD
jgi:hypothetical protein